MAASLRKFADVHTYQEQVKPLLETDIELNTVCCSEVAALEPSMPGSLLAICCCPACAAKSAVFSPGFTDTGSPLFNQRLYVSSGLCKHAAEVLSKELQNTPWTCLHVPGDSAAALQAAAFPMQLLQKMNIMVHKLSDASEATAASGAPAPASTQTPAAADTSSSAGQPDGPSTAGTTTTDGQLRTLSRNNADAVNFILSWSADFIQESFRSPIPPTEGQVRGFVEPWLQQGQYYVLDVAAGGSWLPSCLLCHIPTTSTSSRIVLVYTPAEKRKRGYARVAVRALCKVLGRQYSHICLMASQSNTTANKVYQDVGFVTVGEMHIVKNPGLPTDPQQPNTTGNTDTASQQDNGTS